LLNDPIQTDAASRDVPTHPRLDVALEELTVHEREAIEAVLINGVSYSEMAQHGESIGTIKSRIRSGLSKLRRSMQERGGE
jgi:DNA-directed RNA polymerase specialized sigma24 family protein